jgi:hypothetical protein
MAFYSEGRVVVHVVYEVRSHGVAWLFEDLQKALEYIGEGIDPNGRQEYSIKAVVVSKEL